MDNYNVLHEAETSMIKMTYLFIYFIYLQFINFYINYI